MKTRTHFAHSIDMLDAAGELLVGVSPVFDREGLTLLDHRLMRRDRRLLLGGLHLGRRVRLGERDN